MRPVPGDGWAGACRLSGIEGCSVLSSALAVTDVLAPSAKDAAAAFRGADVVCLGRLLVRAQLELVRSEFARLFDPRLFDRCVVGGYAGIVHDSWRDSAAFAALVPELAAAVCDANCSVGVHVASAA